mmetsp:Transcript_13233/g.32007  ORF Transcript_13233/g.32007 Transcript_13233/m.32007 type:complete len:210 (+) Transcript_13233:142-771(+)
MDKLARLGEVDPWWAASAEYRNFILSKVTMMLQLIHNIPTVIPQEKTRLNTLPPGTGMKISQPKIDTCFQSNMKPPTPALLQMKSVGSGARYTTTGFPSFRGMGNHRSSASPNFSCGTGGIRSNSRRKGCVSIISETTHWSCWLWKVTNAPWMDRSLCDHVCTNPSKAAFFCSKCSSSRSKCSTYSPSSRLSSITLRKRLMWLGIWRRF